MFLAGKYKTQASYFTKEELKQIIEELINLDRNSKIGLIDINIGLELLGIDINSSYTGSITISPSLFITPNLPLS